MKETKTNIILQLYFSKSIIDIKNVVGFLFCNIIPENNLDFTLWPVVTSKSTQPVYMETRTVCGALMEAVGIFVRSSCQQKIK